MRIPLIVFLLVLFSANAFPQAPPPPKNPLAPDQIEVISANVARMATAVEIMNRNWYTFFQRLSSDKGGEYFTDEQKRLLFALEVLNRYEKSLATAQELRLSLIERQSKLRMQLAGITDDLRPESVDRFTVWRGTTDAEGVRNIRRQALQKEQTAISATLSQIGSELAQTADEIRRTEQQIRNIRTKIFGEIDKELAFP